jgi:hypothetical protein
MPKRSKSSVRLVKRGDIVRTSEGVEEVVRGVQVVLQLSNGNNEVHDATDRVEVLPPEELPDLESAE